MFIFYGHGSHVIFEAIEQTQTFWLNMVTLPSHTSHALQPLDIACFKPFKTTFRKEIDITMITRNYIERNKIVLVGLMDKAIDQALLGNNIILGFKSTRLWPLDPKVMDEKTKPSSLYILVIILKNNKMMIINQIKRRWGDGISRT
jgi:hypothetical protein